MLPNAVVGSNHTPVELTWADESGAVLDLTGAAITGFITGTIDGQVRAIDGALDVVLASAGVFTWRYGTTDVSAEGKFWVQFVATFGDSTVEKSYWEEWQVLPAMIASV